jgi:hypothetical protein
MLLGLHCELSGWAFIPYIVMKRYSKSFRGRDEGFGEGENERELSMGK